MCFIWKKPRLPELTTREIEIFFKRSNNFSWVGLTGGEVFLREDLLDISEIVIKHCKNLCILHFPTNGFLTGRIITRVKEILTLGPQRLFVTISVDGPKDIHDKLRGISGSWQNAVDTFIALNNLPGAGAFLSMTLCRENIGSIDETISAVKSLYPSFNPNKMMNFNAFQQSGHYFENLHLDEPEDGLLLSDIQKALSVVGPGKKFKNYLQKNYLRFYEPYLKTGRSPLPCQALSASCFINPYGDIYPCGVFNKIIGNIKDADFSLNKTWKDDTTKEIQLACKNGKCPGCWTPCDAYQSINGVLTKEWKRLLGF